MTLRISSFLCFFAGTLAAAPSWTSSTWSGVRVFPSADNLLAAGGVSLTVEQTEPGEQYASQSALHDNVITTYGTHAFNGGLFSVSSDAVLTFALPEEIDMGELQIYSHWSNEGRDGIAVAKVEAGVDGATFTTIDGSGFSAGMGASSGSYVLSLAEDGGAALATGVKFVRVTFGAVENGYAGVAEIRVLAPRAPDALVWSACDWSGAQSFSDASVLAESGVALAVDQTEPGENYFNLDGIHDNVATDCGDVNYNAPFGVSAIASGATMTFTLAAPRRIAQLDVYTYWSNSDRDGVTIADVAVSTDGETFSSLNAGEFSAGFDNSLNASGRYRLTLSRADGSPLSEKALSAIKIAFGQNENGYAGVVEVRAENTLKWSTEVWSGRQQFIAAENVLSECGVTAAIEQNTPNEDYSNPDALHDNLVTDDGTTNYNEPYGINTISSGAVITFSLPEARTIGGFEFFSYWGDAGRDGITIDSIETSADGESFTALPTGSFAVGVNDGGSAGRYRVTLSDSSAPLADAVRYVRITFGEMDNGYAGVAEIRALRASDGSTHTVTYLGRDGSELAKETVADCEAAAGCEAPAIDGYTFTGWDADISFVTGDMTVKAVYAYSGALAWSATGWSGIPTFLEDGLNVLAEDGVAVSVNQGDFSQYVQPPYGNPTAVLSDDYAHDNSDQNAYNWNTPAMFWVTDGAQIEYTLPCVRDIKNLEIYTSWDTGRDGLEIARVETSADGAAYETLPVDAFEAGITDSATYSTGLIHFSLRNVSGTAIAVGVRKLRITFGNVDNHAAGIVEIRAVRVIHPDCSWAVETFESAVNRSDVAAHNLMRENGAGIVANPNTALAMSSDAANWLTDAGFATLNDGLIALSADIGTTYPIGGGSVFDFNFAGLREVRELDFWTYWPDGGRDGMAIKSIAVQHGESQPFVTDDTIPELVAGTLATGEGNNSSGRYHVRLTRIGGGPLFEHATAVRIRFGVMDNDWSFVQEIEAFGRMYPLQIRLR